MKRAFLAAALLSGLALVPAAHATTVWNFTGTSLRADGYTPTPSGGVGTISVYAFQTNGTQTTISSSTTTLNGLFQVDDTIQDHGAGIAPYNPTEGGKAGPKGTGDGFPNQDGITDDLGGVNNLNNFLELQLGSNIPAGTTLTFLMQYGDAESPSSKIDVFYGDGTVGSGILPKNLLHHLAGNPFTITGDDNTVGQFSITTDGKNEVVALVADCHYLLLDNIKGYASVPEPRFYGILLAGLLGLMGIFVQRRKRAAEITTR
jgi:hypothetical protein